MRDTIWGVLYGDMLIRDLSNARARVDPRWRGYVELMEEMWRRSGPDQRGRRRSRVDGKRAMMRYNEEVQRTVPSDELLVWSVDEGWEPFCRFLEVPVPSIPFPHLNDSKQFGERLVDGALLALQQWRSHDAQAVPAT
jgi:hypothetical protein